MAEAFTAIPDGDVDPESPITTSLMQALRDNPEGIAAGVAGAPPVLGSFIDQITVTSTGAGTVDLSSYDTSAFARFRIWAAGGGGGGSEGLQNSGGGGGGGYIEVIRQISQIGSANSISVSVGAGGGSIGETSGSDGGNSSVTINSVVYAALGGKGGVFSGGGGNGGTYSVGGDVIPDGTLTLWSGGKGGDAENDGDPSAFGGGGGGGSSSNSSGSGAKSMNGGGSGGAGQTGAGSGTDGSVPGGGGGAHVLSGGADAGDGGNGKIIVDIVGHPGLGGSF